MSFKKFAPYFIAVFIPPLACGSSDGATAKLEQQELFAQQYCDIHCDLIGRCAPRLMESMHGSVEKCHEGCVSEQRQAKCLENCTKSPTNFDLKTATECESICKAPKTKDEYIDKCLYIARNAGPLKEEGCLKTWKLMGTDQCVEANHTYMGCLKALTCDEYLSQLTQNGPANCQSSVEAMNKACATDWM